MVDLVFFNQAPVLASLFKFWVEVSSIFSGLISHFHTLRKLPTRAEWFGAVMCEQPHRNVFVPVSSVPVPIQES